MDATTIIMKLPLRLAVAAIVAYASWELMLAVHESGHVLAALIGGGHVERVIVPTIGFSRTDVKPNRSPKLEIWGGPVWGSYLPLAIWIAIRKRVRGALRVSLGFFTGLCLIVNGVYIGIGWTARGGDAADLLKLGTPTWLLILFGLPTAAVGFYVWHRLGTLADLFKTAPA
jgi:hypothetical protein